MNYAGQGTQVVWKFLLVINDGSRRMQGWRETRLPSLERSWHFLVKDWLLLTPVGQFSIWVITFCVSKSSLNVQLGIVSLNVILYTP